MRGRRYNFYFEIALTFASSDDTRPANLLHAAARRVRMGAPFDAG